MPFVEDPAHLPKSRLKSDLVAHNVALPPTASKKDVYVELHLKHVEQKQTADFSSDDEDQERNVADDDDILGDEKLPDARTLTDDELKAALLKYGVKAGPIVASTRSVYENKLRKLLQPEGQDDVSGALTAELYSDSEEEEIQEHGEKDDEESGSEEELTVELTKHAPQESNQAELFNKSSAYSYPQCFIPSTRLRVHPSRLRESIPVRNSRKAKKFFEQRSFHCSKIPTDFSRASSVDHCSGLGLGVLRSDSLKPKDCLSRSTQTFSITQMVKEMESRCSHSPSSDAREEFNGSNEQERWSRSNRLDEPIVDKCRLKDQTLYFTPEVPSHQRGKELPRKHLDDVLKNMYKDTPKTPTGIFVTSRRPIKGAAQRPVEYDYPDPPVSPMTFERREVERRLVPIYIRILLYVLLVCILFFIYINVEEINFVEEWQDRISQWSGSEETKYLQVETEDMDRVFGQE